MPVFARVMMGCLAILVAWSMLRAARTGVVSSEDRSYAENDQPLMFVVIMTSHFMMLLFFVWLAAGYSAEDFLAQLGLGSLFHSR